MRRYPQFNSTPAKVKSLSSVGAAVVVQTVRRKFPSIGDVTSPVQSLLAVPVLAGGGSTGAVSLIHGLTRPNLTSGRLVA